MKDEDSLWRRVAALRGFDLPKLGERAHILGDRFEVQVARRSRAATPVPEEISSVVGLPRCQGVFGEIIVPPAGPPAPRTARVRSNTLLVWRPSPVASEG